MLPRGLVGCDQERVQAKQCTGEHDEYCAYYAQNSIGPVFFCVFFVSRFRISDYVVIHSIEQHQKDVDVVDKLKEEKCPKGSMVKLTHTPSDPEAMVVELADTCLAEIAVLGPVILEMVALIAKILSG